MHTAISQTAANYNRKDDGIHHDRGGNFKETITKIRVGPSPQKQSTQRSLDTTVMQEQSTCNIAVLSRKVSENDHVS